MPPKIDPRSGRPKRIPVHQRKVQKFRTDKDPHYHYHVVNDIEDRVEVFKEAGYEVVSGCDVDQADPQAGKPGQVGSPVIKSVGGGIQGVLMRIPIELYNEDQEAKAQKIKETERSMDPDVRKQMSDPNYGDTSIGSIRIGRS